MGSTKKIIVLKRREIIYTAIFLALAITLVVLLVFIFLVPPKETSPSSPSVRPTEQESETAPSQTYLAGVYTTPVTLSDTAVDVEVVVDEEHINSIRLVNLSESTAAMYPLMSPALDELAAQVIAQQSLDGITCPEENRYTSQVLLNAITDALSQARVRE